LEFGIPNLLERAFPNPESQIPNPGFKNEKAAHRAAFSA